MQTEHNPVFYFTIEQRIPMTKIGGYIGIREVVDR